MSTTTIDDSKPKARRAHQCDDCRRIIEPGETYRRWRGTNDDGIYTWKSCAHCDRLTTWIWSDPESRYMWDEGLDVHEWIIECELPDLQRQYRAKWAGVAVEDVAIPSVAASLTTEDGKQ